jgi:hypothetical protein
MDDPQQDGGLTQRYQECIKAGNSMVDAIYSRSKKSKTIVDHISDSAERFWRGETADEQSARTWKEHIEEVCQRRHALSAAGRL